MSQWSRTPCIGELYSQLPTSRFVLYLQTNNHTNANCFSLHSSWHCCHAHIYAARLILNFSCRPALLQSTEIHCLYRSQPSNHKNTAQDSTLWIVLWPFFSRPSYGDHTALFCTLQFVGVYLSVTGSVYLLPYPSVSVTLPPNLNMA